MEVPKWIVLGVVEYTWMDMLNLWFLLFSEVKNKGNQFSEKLVQAFLE